MKMFALILTVIAATLPLDVARAQNAVNPSRQQQIEDCAKKCKELQEQRIDVLETLVNINTVLFQSARVQFDEVYEAQSLLLEAKLDVAEKESDRIALYGKMVELLKQYEQWAEARAQRAEETQVPVLKIKARRLEAEIRLEQAKAKEAKKNT
ncbi:MAG TPA: hypothetical protein VHZ24_09385 [Pirellulales bacterium]|jgi:hypothetical protein|nr:hypothetical protein [Pirellulales bacterium]